MAEAVETADREEQKTIATHFLRNSPPGQFAAVLQDVQTLCAPSPLDDEFGTSHEIYIGARRVARLIPKTY